MILSAPQSGKNAEPTRERGHEEITRIVRLNAELRMSGSSG